MSYNTELQRRHRYLAGGMACDQVSREGWLTGRTCFDTRPSAACNEWALIELWARQEWLLCFRQFASRTHLNVLPAACSGPRKSYSTHLTTSTDKIYETRIRGTGLTGCDKLREQCLLQQHSFGRKIVHMVQGHLKSCLILYLWAILRTELTWQIQWWPCNNLMARTLGHSV